uniref:Capsule gland specific secretory protein n=1 Tax=Reishia bronni TaxID=578817 RepID=A0A6G9KRI8_9CAEN|nr:capsule gland specific secretory protein [Reishia bronni]
MRWSPFPLLSLLFVFLYTQAVLGNLFNSTSFNITTNGTSGPLCTEIGRHCLKNVSCVNQECVCPPGSKGNGLIECIKKSNMLCVVAADPHLVTFADAKVNVDLPCTYRLTRFVTGHRSRYTPYAYCAVEVSATNILSYGRYYVGNVHMSVGVVDSGRHIKDVFEVFTHGVKNNETYKYYADLNHTRVLWGSSVHEQLQGWRLHPTFDTVNNFAVVEVPECEVRIKYRAFCPGLRRQHLLPGISIMAPDDSKFLPSFGDYPNSLCGTGGERRSLFELRADQLGLKSKKLVTIYDILNIAPTQLNHEMAEKCEEAFDVFSTSSNKVDDLNYCGDILTNAKTRLCTMATQEKYRPLTVFMACMRLQQGASSPHCQIIKSVRQQCGNNWQGPDISCTV